MHLCKVVGTPVCHCSNDDVNDSKLISRPKDALRKLFTDHAVYTKMFLAAFLDSRLEADVLGKRLFANQTEIGQYFGLYLGNDVGTAIDNLLTEHIKGVAVLLAALKFNTQFNEALNMIYNNVNKVAHALSTILGSTLTFEVVQHEFRHHNDMVIELAKLHFGKQYQEEIDTYDEYFVHMMKFSDLLCEGLIH
jgi:hypothetical protein